MAGSEYEAASADVVAAFHEYHGAAQAVMDRTWTGLWPSKGAEWSELAVALKRHADLARDSGEPPERMIILLKSILEETMPRDDRAPDLRDRVVSLSIATYFEQGY
jgi:hypothetical protein